MSSLAHDCSHGLQATYERYSTELKQLLDALYNARPRVEEFGHYVEGQLSQMKKEIENDKALNDAFDVL